MYLRLSLNIQESNSDNSRRSSNSIVLSRLRTLHWEDWSQASDHATLFRYLSLPSLYELKWTFTHFQRQWSISDGPVHDFAFEDVLKHSGHNLKEVQLKMAGHGPLDRLFRCLRFAPGIERLRVETCKGSATQMRDSQVWELLSLPIADQASMCGTPSSLDSLDPLDPLDPLDRSILARKKKKEGKDQSNSFCYHHNKELTSTKITRNHFRSIIRRRPSATLATIRTLTFPLRGLSVRRRTDRYTSYHW